MAGSVETCRRFPRLVIGFLIMSQLSFSFETPSALLSPDEIYQLSDGGEIMRRLGEDRRLERKPGGFHAKQLGEYVCMWANTSPSGGLIAVGIEDAGSVSGCHQMTQEQINSIEKAAFMFCSEARTESKRVGVTASDGSPSFIILIRVYYREDRVVFDAGSHAYIRIGDEKHKLGLDEIRELQNDKGQLDFEQELSVLEFPDDFDAELLARYLNGLRRVREPLQDHSDVELLEHRHLGKHKNGKFIPNNACVLLFAKSPSGPFPGCKVRFLRVEGEVELSGEQYNVVRDTPIEGPVPTLIEESARVIESQLRNFSRLGGDGTFFKAPEYPRAAWFEALVNACVHRSYGLKNMNIFVKMFDDKLVIESPGGFPPSVTPQNIYGAHHPRNPHLMDAMFYLGFVKEHGEGARRMRDTMTEMMLPQPEFRQTETGTGAATVRVTLRNNVKQRRFWIDTDVAKILGEALAKALSEEERLVLNFVVVNSRINVSQCQRQVKSIARWHAAKRLLMKMVAKGLLDYHKDSPADRSPTYFTLPSPAAPTRSEGKNGKSK